MPPKEAVVGIYRQFNRSSRIAARILRTLLGPATCHTLTVASPRSPGVAGPDGRGPGVIQPERLDLVIDVSRLPHPQARAVADAAGAPLITRAFPTMRQESDGRRQVTALDRGTATGRAIALNRSGMTSRVSSPVARGAVHTRPGR